MLRVELTTQLLRLRTVIALAGLAAVPVVAGLATASSAGQRLHGQDGLFGAAPYSALNHAMASLEFAGPLLLPIVVALLAAAIGSADRDWGILRYLYVAPVTRGRLLAGKLAAVVVATAAAVAVVLVAGVLAGLAVFGWHPFHVLGGPDLSATATLGRVLGACGYLTLCMLSIAAIAFALGLLLPRGAEAVAAAIAFVVVASILNGQADQQRGLLHAVAVALPVHYWQAWPALLTHGPAADLGPGIAVQAVAVVGAAALAAFVLHRRDPAA
ncbi:ABC transporter permease [Dactylosporangium vinaceum]|uniref:ABC transporter permease n=1 Tax=Dactylosporangium vinaceum TaxID=53362 RepID=A0ABV5MDL3_9ACTN|nr:ABC transporter permease [Dactylosporangium vinaceum]UAC01130.1 ABC transporter permease [Dactylosporangium vinaceum]